MKVASRIVMTIEEYKGCVGTVMDYDNKVFSIMLDSGESFQCERGDFLPIDDITNIGNIRFEKGMRIYDVQLNKVGEILEIEEVEGVQNGTVKFDDGTELTYPLFEEFNFNVIR
jgi:hypothetical protein